jgi:hypothetical protein
VLVTSDEYYRLLVTGFFVRFLGREPDATTLSGFVAALRAGARQEDLITIIVSSAEYFGKV